MTEQLTIDGDTGAIVPAPTPDEQEPFVLTPLGMAVNGRPSITEWALFGRKLWGIRVACQWAIGDWIIYGESRTDWGEMYDQAVADFDYDYGYLTNMVSVARKFDFSRRVKSLSWSHHQAVAALPEPEQNRLLAEAVEKKWGREDLRAIVKKMQPGYPNPPRPIILAGLEGVPCKVVRVNHEMRFAVFEFEDTPAGYAALKALVSLWRDEEKGLLVTVAQQPAESD